MSYGVCFQSVTNCPKGKHFVLILLQMPRGVGTSVSCEGPEKVEAGHC
jgi:hypothetical protein